jgi:predicted phosphodiesterase
MLRLTALLGLLLAGCGPGDPFPNGSYPLAGTHGLNHPNAVVAKQLQQSPVSYPLRFVLMADVHTPTGNATFATLRQQMLLLDPPPSFIVIIGDLVETGTAAEHQAYLSIIDPFPIPIFSAIGNHEMYPGNRPSYEIFHGPENFAFDYGSCRFVVLNDIIPRRNGLTDAQIDWLASELADPATPNRFVLMHASPPVVPPPWGPPPFFNEDRFYRLVESAGVRLVASGHVHEFRHKLARGVHYLVTGGGGGNQDDLLQDPANQGIFHHFVLVTVYADGKIKLEVVKEGELAEPDPDYTIWL